MASATHERLGRVWSSLLPRCDDADLLLSLQDEHKRALLLLLRTTITLSQEILQSRDGAGDDATGRAEPLAVSPCERDAHLPVNSSMEDITCAGLTHDRCNSTSLLECTQFSPSQTEFAAVTAVSTAAQTGVPPLGSPGQAGSPTALHTVTDTGGLLSEPVSPQLCSRGAVSKREASCADNTRTLTGQPPAVAAAAVVSDCHDDNGQCSTESHYGPMVVDETNMDECLQQPSPVLPSAPLSHSPVRPELEQSCSAPVQVCRARSHCSTVDGTTAAGAWQRRQLIVSPPSQSASASAVGTAATCSAADATQFSETTVASGDGDNADVTDALADHVTSLAPVAPSLAHWSRGQVSVGHCTSPKRHCSSASLSPIRLQCSSLLPQPGSPPPPPPTGPTVRQRSSRGRRNTSSASRSEIGSQSVLNRGGAAETGQTKVTLPRHSSSTVAGARVARSASASASAANAMSTTAAAPSAEQSVQLTGAPHSQLHEQDNVCAAGVESSLLEDTAHFRSLLCASAGAVSSAVTRKVCSTPLRNKVERKKLPGWSCDLCKKWYEHRTMTEQERQKLIQQCSRHRDRFGPRPTTPPGFWDPVGFNETDNRDTP